MIYIFASEHFDRIELWNVEHSVNTCDILAKAHYNNIEKHHKELTRLESNVTYIKYRKRRTYAKHDVSESST